MFPWFQHGAEPSRRHFDIRTYTPDMSNSWPDLDVLVLFVAVVNSGSLGAGARKVGMAQPNASRAVALLESSSRRPCCTAPRAVRRPPKSGSSWPNRHASCWMPPNASATGNRAALGTRWRNCGWERA
ncbi:LysR family transcriptional regulator [Arthrobacter sp. JCM 19049]|uniref:helix-turn-helix domain-containing protein n=1 Tax=Arthrobacter sp. JCM 19049 TaxID=1460643 RepID=UPI0035B552C5